MTNSQPSLINFSHNDVTRVEKDITGKVIQGNPTQGSWLHCDIKKAGARFGQWECQAGTFRAKMDGIVEFCHILEGEAYITNLANGAVHTVRAGDSFVMEAEFDGEWLVSTYIKKSFVICDVKG